MRMLRRVILYPYSERHRLRINTVSKVRANTSFGDNIYLLAQQIFQILPEAYQVQKAASRLHLHREAKVAISPLFPSRYRTEDPDVTLPNRTDRIKTDPGQFLA